MINLKKIFRLYKNSTVALVKKCDITHKVYQTRSHLINTLIFITDTQTFEISGVRITYSAKHTRLK